MASHAFFETQCILLMIEIVLTAFKNTFIAK